MFQQGKGVVIRYTSAEKLLQVDGCAIPSKRELNCSPIQAALPLCNSNFNTPSRTTKLMAAPCAVAPSASEIIRLLAFLAFSISNSELLRMFIDEDTKISWQASTSSILRYSLTTMSWKPNFLPAD